MHRAPMMTERFRLSRRQLITAAVARAAVLPLASLGRAGTAFAQPFNDHTNRVLRGDTKMMTRKLGDLEVSQLGAGCMSISANYGPAADRQQGVATIRE